jgi:hypothetical protein
MGATRAQIPRIGRVTICVQIGSKWLRSVFPGLPGGPEADSSTASATRQAQTALIPWIPEVAGCSDSTVGDVGAGGAPGSRSAVRSGLRICSGWICLRTPRARSCLVSTRDLVSEHVGVWSEVNIPSKGSFKALNKSLKGHLIGRPHKVPYECPMTPKQGI